MSAAGPLWLRITVLLSRRRLDDRIAGGCSYDSSARLAVRARQLTHPWARQRLARDLRRVVEYADRVGTRRFVSPIRVEPTAVRSGREAILGLAELLDRPAPVSPRGIVLTRKLLTDALNSPLFDRYCERSVAEAVLDVAGALRADRVGEGSRAAGSRGVASRFLAGVERANDEAPPVRGGGSVG
jgi:hypothetical protein